LNNYRSCQWPELNDIVSYGWIGALVGEKEKRTTKRLDLVGSTREIYALKRQGFGEKIIGEMFI
jgi:hypothetical protein